jgi:hypothetical protein
MPRKSFTPEQIIAKLRQVEVLISQLNSSWAEKSLVVINEKTQGLNHNCRQVDNPSSQQSARRR